MDDDECTNPGRTRQIHQNIQQIKFTFPDVAAQAGLMLDGFKYQPPTKPIGSLPQETQQQRQDYDVAFYLIGWVSEP